MRMFRLPYVLLATGFLVLGLSAGVVSALQLDWYANHKALNTRIGDIDWVNYYFKNGLLRMRNEVLAGSRPGLPEVRLYIPVGAQRALMENPPDSTKDWKQGFMLYPDGSPQKMQVRYRGDNPLNWLFAKKSLRIKTRKENLLNEIRSFNYAVPQTPSLVESYFGYKLAAQTEVSAPTVRMVEVFVNDMPYGVLTEYEELDESFLRNTGYMPVNFYKGEQAHIERAEGIELDLFNNPSQWEKISLGNDLPENDKSDIEFFLRLTRQAALDKEAYSELKRVAPFSVWARYAAYQVLAQNAHNGGYNNQRLIVDPWRGEVHPTVNDPHFLEEGWKGPWRSRSHPEMQNGPSGTKVRADLEIDSQSLLRLYNRDSAFIYDKYRFLYGFLTEKRLLEGVRNEIAALSGPLVVSAGEIPDLWFSEGWPGFPFASPAKTLRGILDTVVRDTADLEAYLIGQMEALPTSSWQVEDGNLLIHIDGHVPMDGVKIQLPAGAAVPTTIAWDRTGDGRLGNDDMAIPFAVSSDGIELDATWLANRTVVDEERYRHASDYPRVRIDPRATRFVLVADVPMTASNLTARNAVTRTAFAVPEGNMQGTWPGRFNSPVIPEEPMPTQEWKGEISISGTQAIDAPVHMAPGTDIRMAPGAILIFRNKVDIAGTPRSPVIIAPAEDGKPFGLVALQGQGTAGSSIYNLHMSGGTGGRVNNVQYTGMLNIHNSRHIELRDLALSDNSVYDDMLHVIYTDDVRIEGIQASNAKMDAIDIDISKRVQFLGGMIKGSGNDGIDLMSSDVSIEGVVLSGNGDKGISVGESTDAVVRDSRIEFNTIGIQSKDGSMAKVYGTTFVGNATQLGADIKNWRYGHGGGVEITDSVLTGNDNVIQADPASNIRISNSQVTPLVAPGGRVIFDNVRGHP